MPLNIRWSDLDALNHVNNAVYLTYFEEARVKYFNDVCQWDWTTDGLILARIEIDYVKPMLFTHKPIICTRCIRIGKKSFDLEYYIFDDACPEKQTLAIGKSVLVCFEFQTHSSVEIPIEIKNKLILFDNC